MSNPDVIQRITQIIHSLPFAAALLLLGATLANASIGPDEYEKALQIAQKKVERESAGNRAGALVTAPASRIVGRFYEVGDKWDVAVWRNLPVQMRRTSHPQHLKTSETQPMIFRYEVVEVKTGADARVILEVRQIGERQSDHRVDHLRIELNTQLLQSRKAYKLFSISKPIAVSTEGVRSPMTPLEMLPLDFPNVVTAQQSAARAHPDLPEHIAKFAQRRGYAPDLSKSAWFEQDDFFGRPVQILWQHGDPWPSYLKTPYGIAILIRSGGNS